MTNDAAPTLGATETTEREHDEYRIESKRPRSRRWEYISASFTTAGDLAQARRNLGLIIRQSSAPGWRYRIVHRRVRTIRVTTAWDEVPVSDD